MEIGEAAPLVALPAVPVTNAAEVQRFSELIYI